LKDAFTKHIFSIVYPHSTVGDGDTEMKLHPLRIFGGKIWAKFEQNLDRFRRNLGKNDLDLGKFDQIWQNQNLANIRKKII